VPYRADKRSDEPRWPMRRPGARIVVTGYPHLFEPAPGDTNAAIIASIKEATDELNATIEQAVTVTCNSVNT